MTIDVKNGKSWKPFTFSNIIVKDSPLGNYLGGISFGGHATSEDVFVFDNCKWINNICNSDYGGGSGLWLVNEKQLMEMKFVNCEFKGNHHTTKGGAFHDGHSQTISNMKLNFQSCQFIDNTAGTYGGALAIETTGNLVIDGCSFTSNTAKEGGGAIFIHPEYINIISQFS
ncbi:hypothetical protein TRFO_27226 [Tritrichomonas foetus]|uniref:Right handed beta helix domain-containing protein n=1 Tax=Tritrichomonas foetus TaxID=1144522 RepID=A0A1J4K1P0_9EUKA|nr:hypothetical protein TRFO_27226 [Tritrichomonas foetus]|eukprot:OHT05155.1 hypothetical protein TRFO_27226 [Tritrichomonas foetus]